jgi:hypothetical protein
LSSTSGDSGSGVARLSAGWLACAGSRDTHDGPQQRLVRLAMELEEFLDALDRVARGAVVLER